MKWNWGTKTMLVFSIFASGMLLLVFMSMKQKVQMVTKEYYKDELHYQQVIDATNAANSLSSKVEVRKENGQVIISLPKEMQGEIISGTLTFYCAAEAANDNKIKLQVDLSGKQLIPCKQFRPGNYVIKIEWQHKGKQYYTEQFLTI